MGISAGHKSAILEHSQGTSESTGAPRVTDLTFRRRLGAQLPNALSAMRFALAAGWIQLAAQGHQGRAAFVAIAVVAATSDFIDGRIARRLGAATTSGRWLDAVADVTFVLAALFSAAAVGAIPYYIPILIAVSFSQFALDSILISRAAATRATPAGPIKSRLGHWGGIINYALVIALAAAPTSGDPTIFARLHFVGILVRAIAPALALFYCAAIAERALTYRRRG
ncbi:MAG TPA: CDP-alcohol phosphatidyltransferase family protein [Candidatus Acidoferrales bacterium]|nr:CDP-alcohol phosphatidyltransferase family protein [Candidatus Acidoferrales bacterium]